MTRAYLVAFQSFHLFLQAMFRSKPLKDVVSRCVRETVTVWLSEKKPIVVCRGEERTLQYGRIGLGP